MAKILLLDIETSPNMAYVWKFFKENIGVKQVVAHTEIMSFACKWLGDPVTTYWDKRDLDETGLLEELWEWLNDADMVVAHNGSRFDLPTINGRFLVAGITPPSPYKIIDTCTIARNEFNFPSNSLAYLSSIFGVVEKDDHKKFPGFELWLECLKDNPEAWEEMEKYNIQDVTTLEQVYLKMRPFMRKHPNVGVFDANDLPVCPKCGSSHLQYRGYATTAVSRFHRFQCNDCGGWGRSRLNVLSKEKRLSLMVNAID